MLLYSRDTLESMKKTINIIDLAKKLGIEVIQNGNIYQAKCKHEGDNTPSLTFYPETNTFYCFGCQETGDIIRLVSWYLNLSFPQAIERLSVLYGIKIEDRTASVSVVQDKLMIKNRGYWKTLFTNEKALQYLKERHIDTEDIKKWRMGLVPENHGNYSNRLVFAIMDEHSNTVGFAYRSLDGSKPKYLNSSDSNIFKKSNILYGYNYVRNLVREKNYVLLVEGYTDVIQLQKLGIPAVALMGTSLSNAQMELLKQLRTEVFVFTDPDEAGLIAMEKIANLLKENKIPVKVIISNTGQDPDELALALNETTASYIEERAVFFESYKTQTMIAEYKMKIDEINIKFFDKVFPLLTTITNPAELEYQIAIISESCGIDKQFIYRILTKGGYYEQVRNRN